MARTRIYAEKALAGNLCIPCPMQGGVVHEVCIRCRSNAGHGKDKHGEYELCTDEGVAEEVWLRDK